VSEPQPAPGLQRERTALAWDRTGLALIVTGAVLVRAGGEPYAHARHLPGYLAGVLGAVLLIHAQRRYARRAATGESLVSPGLARLVGIAATAVGVAALLVVLVELA
jgi:uncharacterized membrane protein YidH (DUF202 family)